MSLDPAFFKRKKQLQVSRNHDNSGNVYSSNQAVASCYESGLQKDYNRPVIRPLTNKLRIVKNNT